MSRFPSLIASLAIYLAVVSAQSGQICSNASPCPASAPCCSSFGFCGDGSYCLGGCNPLASYSSVSCRPNPVCQSATYSFTNNSRICSNASLFNGNATAYDWVVNQGTIFNTNSSGGELALVLTQNNGGTRISSTRYVHYGKITATMKTGRWSGVVTAFITMSGIKDEIDWEFPGANTTTGQTNFFWQGNIPNKTQGEVENGISDTYSNYHAFAIDWQPDNLTFLIDNKVVRTVNRADTVDSNGVAHYPTTPSSIQISLWPAGINTSAPGTIEWAGGMVNWQDPDYQSAGHFYALVKSVDVQCTDPTPPGPNVTSYVYDTNSSAMTPSIVFSNQSIVPNGAPIPGLSFNYPWWLLGALSLVLIGIF
ncbi:concanavalin A-like lectin/glucanase domain-containing protein [Lactifluus subvellereus]|nr:concanavalin A-like lectin/glucanase domain-containing protein [Lactifluus subvellereus]